ncbi:voltage-dependent T-type calcium channel subunit alpha-1I [Platysternon megacephalum]|uniref:Voltage-dependent T-type calcium channel subunit alpha-1I n=1 Tax=Platysternon megacephalum TaxID=55544 RepID=A0A4D9ELN8_9SAUR|nr:voltage-dependent T-type calcium channel subunit alpha-1I [Platysternon megacephalum]
MKIKQQNASEVMQINSNHLPIWQTYVSTTFTESRKPDITWPSKLPFQMAKKLCTALAQGNLQSTPNLQRNLCPSQGHHLLQIPLKRLSFQHIIGGMTEIKFLSNPLAFPYTNNNNSGTCEYRMHLALLRELQGRGREGTARAH